MDSLKRAFKNFETFSINSFRNLRIERESRNFDNKKEAVNFDAGIELLQRYQTHWNEIHKKTENSALCAAEADEMILKFYEDSERQSEKIAQLSSALANIPQVIHGVQEICDLILNMQCGLDEVEDALFVLEDLIETQELREKQLDHRFQLALYSEKRMSELENLKDKLTEEHMQKIEAFEKRKSDEAKAKQLQFQRAFDADMTSYKVEGTIPKKGLSTETSTPSLEEIELEDDPFVLEDFLSDADRLPEQTSPNENKNTSID